MDGLVYLAIAVVVVFLVYWFLLRGRHNEWAAFSAPPVEKKTPEPEAAPAYIRLRTSEAPVVEAGAPAPVKPDDLTILEGIGPKVCAALGEAGITTFARLAAADLGEIKLILEKAGYGYMDPGTWPEQASLAARGDRAGLKALTDTLRGGRRA